MTTYARDVFDQQKLADICAIHEDEFWSAYDLDRYAVAQPAPNDFYYFRDNGADVLAVAHLDTVGRHATRAANFVETEAGLVVYSRALDDRLGTYVILEMLPALGIETDILLTVGEESGRSTASAFTTDRRYDHIIEFDRGGTDVVMYDFEDEDLRSRVKAAGGKVGVGIFSDICYLEHLGSKAINWGVGYQDYHSSRSHAFLEDTFDLVDQYTDFYAQNLGIHLPHDESPADWWMTEEELSIDEVRERVLALDDDNFWKQKWVTDPFQR